MRSTVSMSRAAVAGALLVGLAATSGCSWFHKSNDLYTQQTRPLEVPPDLDLPRAASAMEMPAGPVTASGTVAAAPQPPVQGEDGQAAPVVAGAAEAPAAPAATGSSSGFVIAGSRDDAFAKVDTALAAIDGVTIASRAKLLGAFDVNYRDSNFLVRVSETEAGAYISTVDPRGMPATGEAPVELLAALKSALGGR